MEQGDIVQLLSGGPKMTVDYVTDGDDPFAHVIYFGLLGTYNGATIRVRSLKKVENL